MPLQSLPHHNPQAQRDTTNDSIESALQPQHCPHRKATHYPKLLSALEVLTHIIPVSQHWFWTIAALIELRNRVASLETGGLPTTGSAAETTLSEQNLIPLSPKAKELNITKTRLVNHIATLGYTAFKIGSNANNPEHYLRPRDWEGYLLGRPHTPPEQNQTPHLN